MSPDESPQDEPQLAARAVAGDEVALSQLLFRCHDRLVGEIGRKLPADIQGSIAAEDIAQEAYVVAFQRIASFNPQDHERFFAWLFAIARNRLMDAIKAHRTAKRGGGRVEVVTGQAAEDDDVVRLLETLAAHSRTPSRSAAGHEAAEAVGRALASLPPDYAEALRLRYLESLPIAEVAARMNRSEGSIHMLCNRALKALKRAMGETSRFLSRKF